MKTGQLMKTAILYSMKNSKTALTPISKFKIEVKAVAILKNLALSYFPRGQPPKYLRRNSVSQSSSGWSRSGATALQAPGMLIGIALC